MKNLLSIPNILKGNHFMIIHPLGENVLGLILHELNK